MHDYNVLVTVPSDRVIWIYGPIKMLSFIIIIIINAVNIWKYTSPQITSDVYRNAYERKTWSYTLYVHKTYEYIQLFWSGVKRCTVVERHSDDGFREDYVADLPGPNAPGRVPPNGAGRPGFPRRQGCVLGRVFTGIWQLSGQL